MAEGIIYCITNLINNKKYIGSSIGSLAHRKAQHIYCSKKKENNDKYYYPLYCAFRKYGLENFSFDVIENFVCSEYELRTIEQKYIMEYDCLIPKGYNQTLNTEHPINDEKAYQKIRETKRNKAKCVAEIDKEFNIINIYRSIVDCAEELNISEKHIASCCRGERRSTGNKYFCWVDENNELIIPKYIGATYKGDKGTTQKQKTNRKVLKIDLNTNEILNSYDSIALAARENNCDNSAIAKVCRGKRNKCGGFIWRYADEQ